LHSSLDATNLAGDDRAIGAPHIAWVAVLAWFGIVAQLLWLDWRQTAEMLGDTDDAMRLVQVRELLAGRSWFDLHEPRLQPPFGHDTHWSRLIDGGLAGLFILFHAFTDTAQAEHLMRVVWPLLWLIPAMGGALLLAWRLGGRPAAFVALLLLLFGLPAFTQFRPGRIDHHDVQITLAVLTLAAAIWSDRARWAAWTAGAMSGLALAIGLEGLAFIAIAGALMATRYVRDGHAAAALSRYGLALAMSTTFVFFVSIAPKLWLQTACDAMAVNWVAPALAGGLILAAAGRCSAAGWGLRAALLAVAAGLAIGLFIALEPRCLHGPLAMVDPELKPIWLAHVSEAQSLFAVMQKSPLSGYAFAAYPMAALIAAAMLARDKAVRRDSGFLFLLAALIVSSVMTLIAIRAASYALWFGIPFVAAAFPRIYERLGLKTLPAKALITLPFTPILLSVGVIALVDTVGGAAARNDEHEADALCFESTNSYQPLAHLAPGLVVADIDYGPFVLALTPHAVLAAPYHRMSYGILTSHRIFASPPEEARDLLRAAQAGYVMICGSRGPKNLSATDTERSFWAQLRDGRIPAWLEPIPVAGPLRVYRLKP
jgi:hypothetical protein